MTKRKRRQSRYGETTWIKVFRSDALIQQKRRCYYCRDLMTMASATADHLLARHEGGGISRENIVAACFSCNQAKGVMSAILFKRAVKFPEPDHPLNIHLAAMRRRINIRVEKFDETVFSYVGVMQP